MGFWAWFWIWIGLIVGSLVIFGFIGKSLYNKVGAAGHQVSRVAKQALQLAAALEQKVTVQDPENSVLADPVTVQAKRRALQKVKIKKQEQRKRRLIASLKRFDPNESRFH